MVQSHDDGLITWANLIIATGHNNLALNRGVFQGAKHFVNGAKLSGGMLNRVSAVVRAYDPCFSCSTHASGQIAMHIQLFGPQAVAVTASPQSFDFGDSLSPVISATLPEVVERVLHLVCTQR